MLGKNNTHIPRCITGHSNIPGNEEGYTIGSRSREFSGIEKKIYWDPVLDLYQSKSILSCYNLNRYKEFIKLIKNSLRKH